MTAKDVAAQMGRWRSDGTPLHRSIADQLRLLIRLGLLPPSSELPPERQLAATLDVSRTTVMLAYRLLKEEGWLVSLQGSGTRVSQARATPRGTPADYGAAASGFIADVVRGGGPSLDLTTATSRPGRWLPEAMARIPDMTVTSLADRGYEPAGYPPLRETVSRKLGRDGLSRSADEVIVTSGATQALHLLVTILGGRGSTAVVEELTCPTVLALLRNAGFRLMVVPVADAAAVEAAIHRYTPSLVYLIPTYHNPTGSTVAARGRAAIARAAGERRVPLIEDLTLADVPVSGLVPPPPIASYATEAEIYTVGSMSKLYWPGLRIGWLTAPRRELQRVLHMRAVYDLGSPLPTQLLAHELLPLLPRVREERRQELRRKRDTLIGALDRHLPDWRCDSPDGGLSVWCAAPRPLHRLCEIAQRDGVHLLLGTHFAAGARPFVDHVRIPYTLDENAVVEGVRRLAAYWADAKTE